LSIVFFLGGGTSAGKKTIFFFVQAMSRQFITQEKIQKWKRKRGAQALPDFDVVHDYILYHKWVKKTFKRIMRAKLLEQNVINVFDSLLFEHLVPWQKFKTGQVKTGYCDICKDKPCRGLHLSQVDFPHKTAIFHFNPVKKLWESRNRWSTLIINSTNVLESTKMEILHLQTQCLHKRIAKPIWQMIYAFLLDELFTDKYRLDLYYEFG